MPSLELSFTDDEYLQIQEAAARTGKPLEVFVRDAILDAASGYRTRIAGLAADIAEKSGDLNNRLA